MPLPPGLLAVVSPVHAELRDFALVPLGLEAWRPLTMDAPSTWRAVVRGLSCGGLLATSLQLGRLDGPRMRLISTVAVTGVLVAVVGFGHLLAGAEMLFGVWRYVGNVPLVSFFGNANHLAGFLAFTATVAMALALAAASRDVAIAWAAAALVCASGVVLSFSRGGIAAFLATSVAVGALLWVRRQGSVMTALPFLVIGGTGVFALALAAEPLLDRLSSVTTLERLKSSKLELWPMFWSAASHFRPAGMGLGAFELAFSRFQSTQLEVTFTHPENLVLQWLAEVGAVMTLGLGLSVAWLVWRLWRQWRGALFELTLFIAVLGAFLHDLFDFALELQALPTAMTVVMGVCVARDVRSPGNERRGSVSEVTRPLGLKWSVTRKWLFSATALIGLTALGVWRGFPLHGEAEVRVIGMARAGAPTAVLRDEVMQGIDRHPADWVFYSLMAHELSLSGAARESLAWVNRLLFLRPNDARAHVAAGRALLRLSQPTQALLEFKTAWQLGDVESLEEGLLLASRLRAFDRLMVDRPGLLTQCWNHLRGKGRLDDAQALLDAVFELPPSSAVLTEARVLAISQAQAKGQWVEAANAYETLPAAERDAPSLVVVYASTLANLGRLDEAVTTLDVLARKNPSDVGVASLLADLLMQRGRFREAHETLTRTKPFIGGPQGRSALFQKEADLWVREERWPRALEALQTASRIEPTRADLKYRLATVYEHMGSLHSALDEVRRGRLLDTAEGAKAQDAWVGRLEAALARPGD
jgi:Flp pilus assembly protein TadD/O-antigen ligase